MLYKFNLLNKLYLNNTEIERNYKNTTQNLEKEKQHKFAISDI